MPLKFIYRTFNCFYMYILNVYEHCISSLHIDIIMHIYRCPVHQNEFSEPKAQTEALMENLIMSFRIQLYHTAITFIYSKVTGVHKRVTKNKEKQVGFHKLQESLFTTPPSTPTPFLFFLLLFVPCFLTSPTTGLCEEEQNLFQKCWAWRVLFRLCDNVRGQAFPPRQLRSHTDKHTSLFITF